MLHRAIGLNLVRNRPRLTAAGTRCLHKDLDLPQVRLAPVLGGAANVVRPPLDGVAQINRDSYAAALEVEEIPHG